MPGVEKNRIRGALTKGDDAKRGKERSLRSMNDQGRRGKRAKEERINKLISQHRKLLEGNGHG